MTFEEKYKIGIEDITKKYEATNKAMLSCLENIACTHASSLGFSPTNLNEKGLVWILLNWKIKIIKRPLYNEEIKVRTWSRKIDRVAAFRDFEVYGVDGNLCAIGTSRWFLMDFETRKPVRITDELSKAYDSELDRHVFETEIEKIIEPKEYIRESEYLVMRRDIDMNNHVHNLNYLDIAYEMLPEEVYREKTFNNIKIEYKKEIKYGDKVKCYYSVDGDNHIVTLKVDEKVSALIVLS